MKETIDVLAVAANEDSTVGKEVEFKDNAYQKLTRHYMRIVLSEKKLSLKIMHIKN